MTGAIFYATKYGSTRQYAQWIADATGLPAFDVHARGVDPGTFDVLVIGLPVIYHKLFGRHWVHRHQHAILQKPTILFTVSGAAAGKKLDGWIADSLSPDLIKHVHHVALQGRQNPRDLTWFDRMMLIIGGLMNPDRQAGREERHGFDFMDQESIQPIVEHVDKLGSSRRRSPKLREQAANANANRELSI